MELTVQGTKLILLLPLATAVLLFWEVDTFTQLAVAVGISGCLKLMPMAKLFGASFLVVTDTSREKAFALLMMTVFLLSGAHRQGLVVTRVKHHVEVSITGR